MKTTVGISGSQFTINGRPTYSEGDTADAADCNPQGLLMNARFIQGIFDDSLDPSRFARFGWDSWDAERNTDTLIAALPAWKRFGLLAFTVGLQGGMPCFSAPNETISNNPFGSRGTDFDPAYQARLDRLIRAADEIGMVVIVSILYQGQVRHLADGAAIVHVVETASRWLRDGGYTNVIVEVANEQDVGDFRNRPQVGTSEGMSTLIDIARRESGGMAVGCSSGGGAFDAQIADRSDVVLVHGNGLNRQQYNRFIRRVAGECPGKPVVCNEDSPCYTRFPVAARAGTSWGYYSNLTKQEPPGRWGIELPQDRFCAYRMADSVGIDRPDVPPDEQILLQGFEHELDDAGSRWLSVAALYPEWIDYVEFLLDGKAVDANYDEPFLLYEETTWLQAGTPIDAPSRWSARVHFANGATRTIEPNTTG